MFVIVEPGARWPLGSLGLVSAEEDGVTRAIFFASEQRNAKTPLKDSFGGNLWCDMHGGDLSIVDRNPSPLKPQPLHQAAKVSEVELRCQGKSMERDRGNSWNWDKTRTAEGSERLQNYCREVTLRRHEVLLRRALRAWQR